MKFAREIVAVVIAGSLMLLTAAPVGAQLPDAPVANSQQGPDMAPAGPIQPEAAPAQQTPDELDQLVAPIALYPDALVAQVLAASVHPTEIVEADRWMQANTSLKGQALAQQVDQVTERQLRLAQLEPQYQGLTRDRDVLQNNVRDFTVKEQETQAADAIARQGNDNISIIERAVIPTQGKSLKMPVMLLAILFGGFAALCVGLMRMFLRPGLATSALAGRTLGLPVLATAGVKS